MKWIFLLVVLIAGISFPDALGTHDDPVSSIILSGTLILLFGILGRYIAKKFGQPGVLGELLMGVIVGNLCYYAGMELMVILRDSSALFAVVERILDGLTVHSAVSATVSDPGTAKELLDALSGANGQQWIKITYVVDAFSHYGVIFLLFMVGLDSSLADLKKTGREATQVALIGVIAPIVLGLFAMQWLLPKGEFRTCLFVAATLSATSVGITARVLQDLQKINTREARTILGAAMIDDVLGLLILALVSGMLMTDQFNVLSIAQLLFFSLVFFPLALWLGPMIIRQLIARLGFVEPWEAKLLASFIFLMTFAWLASFVQMSTIIGAFMAGIILNDSFFNKREAGIKNPLSIKTLLSPFEVIFAPVFFMLVGIQVKLETILDPQVMIFAVCLIAVAILGKLLSGLGGNIRDDRLLIGIGMLPRGEVGLVFASVGKTLGVIPENLFSAIVMMIVVTTIMTPIWLKYRCARPRVHHG